MPSTAELYDWELLHLHHRVDQDLGFYRGLALALGGPVLELACGTGRVGGRLAARGVDVTGLDIDRAMLAACRERGVGKVVQGDMSSFAFAPASFALVAIPYNSLQLLPDDAAVVRCLRSAAGAVRPDGLIAFEVTDFAAEDDVDEEPLAEADGISLTGSLRVDGDVLHYRRRFEWDGGRHADALTLRRAGASSAEGWVAQAGLRLVSSDWVGLGLRVVAAPTIAP